MVGIRNDDFGSGNFINDTGEENEIVRTIQKGCSSFKAEKIEIQPGVKHPDVSTSKQHILFSCSSEARSVLRYQKKTLLSILTQ